jgi:hypothetical protein
MADAQVPAREIQALLDRVTELRHAVAEAGAGGRAALARLDPKVQSLEEEIGVTPGRPFDPAAWAARPEPDQVSLRDRLQAAIEQLEAAVASAADEPADPSSIMYRKHASNAWIIFLTAAGILSTVAVLVAVWVAWHEATDLAANSAKGPAEGVVLRMIILMGALGGCLHWTTSLAMYVGNAKLLRRWIPYYVMMPIEGAALAPIVFLLLRTGVLAPPTSGGAATGQLNLVSLYAFAGLTGLFAKQAIEMLAEVFSIVFKKVKAKDPVPEAGGSGQSGSSSTTRSRTEKQG